MDHDTNSKFDIILEKLNTITANVDQHDKTLYGLNGDFGLSQKVNVMWRAHVWVLCTLSAGAGSVITGGIMVWIK